MILFTLSVVFINRFLPENVIQYDRRGMLKINIIPPRYDLLHGTFFFSYENSLLFLIQLLMKKYLGYLPSLQMTTLKNTILSIRTESCDLNRDSFRGGFGTENKFMFNSNIKKSPITLQHSKQKVQQGIVPISVFLYHYEAPLSHISCFQRLIAVMEQCITNILKVLLVVGTRTYFIYKSSLLFLFWRL